MYFFSGGGYGGWWETDGLTNGCSTVGISKTQPVEILEQHYPLVFEEYALREGSSGAGRHRGGYGISYRIRLLRGTAMASFLMDHGREGPPGLMGGVAGATNELIVSQNGTTSIPEHISKGEGYELRPGDWVQVRTPAAAAMARRWSATRCWSGATSSAATSRHRRPGTGIPGNRRRVGPGKLQPGNRDGRTGES